MEDSKSSVSVHVKLTVNPSKTEDFLSALKVIFEKTKLEPLNTFLEIYRDEQSPGMFKLVENWNATADYMMNVSIYVSICVLFLRGMTGADNNPHQVQVKKDYYQAYYAALQPILLKAPEVEIFSRMPDNEWVSVRKECYPGR
ncbi:hypothetical protein PG997_001940 [Apiospora hydei]|uniref:ABM domain-containing protein n=1 Tax=Apiospora hydei TaxID=1337664 RepID=A0ABR1X840_9PEZI